VTDIPYTARADLLSDPSARSPLGAVSVMLYFSLPKCPSSAITNL
jgi:hypothetical protein